MEEHSGEIVKLLLWALGLGGSALVMSIGLIVKLGLGRLQMELRGINKGIDKLATALEATQTALGALERRHETRIVDVERRVDKLHERCAIFHEHGKD